MWLVVWIRGLGLRVCLFYWYLCSLLLWIVLGNLSLLLVDALLFMLGLLMFECFVCVVLN